MPWPSSLFDCATKCIEKHILDSTSRLLEKKSCSPFDISEHLERIYVQTRSIPACLHAMIGAIFLSTARKLTALQFKRTANQEIAIRKLVYTALFRLKPKEIILKDGINNKELYEVYCSAVLRCLDDQLENISWDTTCSIKLGLEYRQVTKTGFLRNLVSFSCSIASDETVRMVCENCNSLQNLDVFLSENVTNNCIASVTNCEQLRKVKFNWTKVTEDGFVQLLLNTQSKHLMQLSGVPDVNIMLKQLEKVTPLRAFGLKKLTWRYTPKDVVDLQLLSIIFPKLVEITKLHYHLTELSPDFSNVDRLAYARKVEVALSVRLGDPFSNFQNLKSSVLTSLGLNFPRASRQIKITQIMQIGLQCPNLEFLSICYASVLDDTSSLEFYSLSGKPFEKLKHLILSHCSSVRCFKDILNYAFAIETIDLLHCSEVLNDEFFECILKTNPLEQLEFLSIKKNEVSYHILKTLITQCKRLCWMSTCDNLSKEHVQDIQKLILKRGSRLVFA